MTQLMELIRIIIGKVPKFESTPPPLPLEYIGLPITSFIVKIKFWSIYISIPHNYLPVQLLNPIGWKKTWTVSGKSDPNFVPSTKAWKMKAKWPKDSFLYQVLMLFRMNSTNYYAFNEKIIKIIFFEMKIKTNIRHVDEFWTFWTHVHTSYCQVAHFVHFTHFSPCLCYEKF